MNQVADEKVFDWKVNIDSFEGPLDLLLHLIKKSNLDIYDIPIAHITSEYLKYLEVMQQLNLDNVGDFLVMASILMSIKARTLLPSVDPETGEEEDPEEMKAELIRRLIEYKKYKESASVLKEKEQLFEGVVALKQYPLMEFGNSVDASLFELVDSFQKLIEKASKTVKDIIVEEFSIDDKMRLIMSTVEKQTAVITITSIVPADATVLELVVTLLAILELVRTHQISVYQKHRFGMIYLERCPEPAEEESDEMINEEFEV